MARVLIVDDNVDMLEMLRVMLQRMGHEVILSADGKDGLEKAVTEMPDLAIVDVMMPGLSGYDVVRQLRADRRTANLAIMILTARGQPVDRMAALEAGADDYMAKPVKPAELLQHLEQLLEHGSQKASGKIFSVFSLRGGIGTTTVAVNLALLLRLAGETTLADLSLNAGHCALALGMRPERHWGLLLEGQEVPVEKLLLPHPSGLKLLATPPLPVRAAWFSEDEVQALLEKLAAQAEYVIVDTPPVLSPEILRILDLAYGIFLISGDDPPGLQTTLATLQVLQDYRSRISVVINAPSPAPHPPLEALQKVLKMPIASEIPFDPAQVPALRRSAPLALSQPETPLVAALKQLAIQIIGPQAK